MTRCASADEMIEVFADVSCPFTHVGLHNLVARRDEIGSAAEIWVKAWPLELVNGEPLASDLVHDEIDALRAQVAPGLFERFNADRFPATTLPALALAAAAYRRNPRVGERVSLSLRDALFEQGLDVSDADVLADISRAHGVTPGPLDEAAVLNQWHEGERRGVVGSPYFIVCGQGFFCPSLKIGHVGDRLEVERDVARLAHFLDVALSPSLP